MIVAAQFAELQKLCLRSLPERLEQSISQIRSSDAGRHPTVSLALSWREGRHPRFERLLVRRYADPWTWWSTDDGGKAQREWTVMRWLYGQGYTVPPLYASGTEGGEAYLLMGHVSGRRPALWDPAQAETYVESLSVELSRLHQFAPPGSIREAVPEVSVGQELGRLGQLARQCSDDKLYEAIAELEAEEMEEYPPCVLHGDLRSDNVLCDARGVTAILGWEAAARGDRRWDVARVTNDLRTHEAGALVETFCARYEDRVGLDLRELAYWEALTAAQGWVLVEWAGERALPQRAAGLLAHRDTLRERAWSALTRWHYGQRDPSP